MVSGVCRASTPQSLGIPVLADPLGVGQNIWDHVESGLIYYVDVGNVVSIYIYPNLIAEIVEEYLFDRAGPVCSFRFDFNGWTKLL